MLSEAPKVRVAGKELGKLNKTKSLALFPQIEEKYHNLFQRQSW